jgi:hypothetical protein
MMLNRRSCMVALAHGLMPRASLAATPRRLALLLAVPWEGESYLADDLAMMQAGLRTRGLSATDVIPVLAPLDRPGLARHAEEVGKRIAAWESGDLFIYYNGHGMYGQPVNGVPEPGLQLNSQRERTDSALLWRELFAMLRIPRRVRVLVLPDCCHTNLLAGRLPPNVTALIMKSDPQTSLNCRTGTALLGETKKRVRHGVISYYAARTIGAVEAVEDWLPALDRAAETDILDGKLEKFRRVSLMIEGDKSAKLLGQRGQPAADPR